MPDETLVDTTAAPSTVTALRERLTHLRGFAREAAGLARKTKRLREADRFEYLEESLTKALTQLQSIAGQQRLLAMLAAETPQFNNPQMAWHAQELRDRLLKEMGR